MNICYVANNRFPSERAHMTQMVHMCNAFAKLGHEVTYLVTDRNTSIKEDPETFFGMPLLFTVDKVSVPDVSGRSSRIPHIFHPALFFVQRFVYAYRASRYIRERKFDIVYGRDEWILWLLTWWITTRMVWESHEARFSFAARKLVKEIPLVVISEGIRDFYSTHKVDPTRILVAYDAVDERFFESLPTSISARMKLGIVSVKPIVLYIGGLESWKGAETLCEAGENQELFEVGIIGGKEKEVSELRLKYPHVHFFGSYPYRELPTLQQAADILVIPNTGTIPLSTLYTSPLKLFTYMTSRKPIVASSIPSITNVLSPDEAFFFTPDSAHDLQQTIQYVLQNPEESKEKSERAYQKSLHSTWLVRARNIVAFLSK
jgi:glycosyltransferase involved in cell wall biosynthesis